MVHDFLLTRLLVVAHLFRRNDYLSLGKDFFYRRPEQLLKFSFDLLHLIYEILSSLRYFASEMILTNRVIPHEHSRKHFAQFIFVLSSPSCDENSGVFSDNCLRWKNLAQQYWWEALLWQIEAKCTYVHSINIYLTALNAFQLTRTSHETKNFS